MFTKVIPVLLCIVFHNTYSQFHEDSHSSKYEGDLCILPDKGQGKCTLLWKCQAAVQDLSNRVRPQTCGFSGLEPIVCCPTSRKSDVMCKKYGEQVKDLQVYAIAGGTGVSIIHHPHMAALGYGDKNNIQWNCGGSLISEKFVLTAAHCLNSGELGPVKFVRLGATILKDTRETPQDFEIVRRIRHPDYKPPSTYHDIALLELNKQVKYAIEVKPSCLHTKPEIDWGSFGLSALGWGLTSFGGDRAVMLQEVYLENFTDAECSKAYRINRRLPQGILHDIQFCAGGRDKEKDTCQGDSGGPLKGYGSSGLAEIIGVTSFGQACGTIGVPGVYTRVSYYVSWIESIVWP